MQNTGLLYACDISIGRLERLKPRLARAGAYNAQSFAIRDEHDADFIALVQRLCAMREEDAAS